VIDFKMNAQDAVDAPRFHHQWQPDRLSLERGTSPDTVALLESWGHKVDFNPGIVLARVEAILNEGKWLAGASDQRGTGKAAGY
jgi:gamma-glutamyltranspeptidase / glutathione hydrolase